MEAGGGRWVRVFGGRVVKQIIYDENETYDFVPVPKECILCTRKAYDRFVRFSVLDVEEQHTMLVYDGQGVSFKNLTDEHFTGKHVMRPFFFPPAASSERSGLLPTTAELLKQIFGCCPMTADALAAWNASVAGALDLRKGANKRKSSVLTMSLDQREWLITKGVLRRDLFHVPPLNPPAAVQAESEEEEEESSEDDLVITEEDLAAAAAETRAQRKSGGGGWLTGWLPQFSERHIMVGGQRIHKDWFWLFGGLGAASAILVAIVPKPQLWTWPTGLRPVVLPAEDPDSWI